MSYFPHSRSSPPHTQLPGQTTLNAGTEKKQPVDPQAVLPEPPPNGFAALPPELINGIGRDLNFRDYQAFMTSQRLVYENRSNEATFAALVERTAPALLLKLRTEKRAPLLPLLADAARFLAMMTWHPPADPVRLQRHRSLSNQLLQKILGHSLPPFQFANVPSVSSSEPYLQLVQPLQSLAAVCAEHGDMNAATHILNKAGQLVSRVLHDTGPLHKAGRIRDLAGLMSSGTAGDRPCFGLAQLANICAIQTMDQPEIAAAALRAAAVRLDPEQAREIDATLQRASL